MQEVSILERASIREKNRKVLFQPQKSNKKPYPLSKSILRKLHILLLLGMYLGKHSPSVLGYPIQDSQRNIPLRAHRRIFPL